MNQTTENTCNFFDVVIETNFERWIVAHKTQSKMNWLKMPICGIGSGPWTSCKNGTEGEPWTSFEAGK